MPVNLNDSTIYNNNVNKPTDGEKLRSDLTNIINFVNGQETVLNTFYTAGVNTATATRVLNADAVTVGGLYYTDNTSTGTPLTAYNYGYLIHTAGVTATEGQQIWLSSAGNYTRVRTGSVWGSWKIFNLVNTDTFQGTTPVWASTTTITMGTLNCLDSLRTSLITCSSTTLNFGTNGLNGLDTGAIASNTWYYIYAILNPTTLATGYLASTSASSPTLPSGFTKFRLLTAVTTLAGSAVLDNVAWFNWGNKHTVHYDNTNTDKTLVASGTATSFTTVSASATAPVGATQLYIGITDGTSGGDRNIWLRRTGSGVTTGRRVFQFYDDNASFTNSYYVPTEIGLNSSRQFDYRVAGVGTGVSMFATGYTMEV